MIGITGYGCYIPRTRLPGSVLAGAWGGSGKGSVAVGSFDEDAITMAAEAALDCLVGHDPIEVDRLYFASTTAPYLEHLNAANVAAVADLRADIMAADFGGSIRAGTSALRAAHDAVKAEEAVMAMVVASDTRLASPGDPAENSIGHAAAAIMVGDGEPIAVFKNFFSSSRVFLDHWRREGDRFVLSGDAKFINEHGIMSQVPELVEEMLKGMDLARDEIASVVYYAPDLRLRKSLDKKLGFTDDAYPQGIPQTAIGDTGTSQVFLSLIHALEQSEPGDLILAVNYGSGADAVLLQVTENITGYRRVMKDRLAGGRDLPSYARYLSYRNLLPQEQLNVWASFPVLWREEKQNVRRLGKKCKACGAVQYPPRYKCWQCGGEDMSTVKIGRKGKIYTFTLDSLVPSPEPLTPMATVDLDGGGRLYAQMTDVDPDKVEIGMEVEMVYRKIHEGGGFNNYFWKFRPALRAG